MGHLISNPTSQSHRGKHPEFPPRALQSVASAPIAAVNLRVSAIIRVVVITCTLAWFVVLTMSASAQAQPPSNAETSTEKSPTLTRGALRRRLKKPITISWTDAPLAERMKAFAAANQLAIFIDRRVDPGTKINIERVNVTIEQLLLDVASEHGIGMCQIDDLIYLGPTSSAKALPLVWRKLPRATSKPATRLEWKALSRPRELMQSISRLGEIKISGIGQISHDLWDEGSLPPMTPTQQVALIAFGFDLWPSKDQSDPNTLKLTQFEPPIGGQLRYLRAARDVGGSGKLKQTLKQKFPDVRFHVVPNLVLMTGPTEMLYAAKAFLIRRNVIEVRDERNIRFTLKTSANRLQILSVIAKQTGRELLYDPALRDLLDQQVKIECHQINLSELVDQILSGTDLKNEVTTSKIQILAP